MKLNKIKDKFADLYLAKMYAESKLLEINHAIDEFYIKHEEKINKL